MQDDESYLAASSAMLLAFGWAARVLSLPMPTGAAQAAAVKIPTARQLIREVTVFFIGNTP
jgi:hypothetical protein